MLAAVRKHLPGRRTSGRWVVRGLVLVALGVGLFGLLPRLGGLSQDAVELRRARPAWVVAAVIAQALSLGCYAQLYRRVLSALGAPVTYLVALRVTLATFLVSHLTFGGSVTGTLENVSALKAEGVDASVTTEAIGLTSLVSSLALVTLLAIGLGATVGEHVLSGSELASAGIALVLIVIALAVVLVLGSHPAVAERWGRRLATVARHVRRSIDVEKVAQTSKHLATLAESAVSPRPFFESFGLAMGDLVSDLVSLDLFFVAFGHQPGLGPMAVAYGAANIVGAIPVTPGGLGVIEVTLLAITVGYGVPRASAVVAILGYRIVNFWLPLLPGAVAYFRIRLGPGAADRR
jgi:uncharacterized protein (TIRG00374 family)